MLRKFENLGTPLTQKEMRKMKGGGSNALILWHCYEGSTGPFVNCRSSDPTAACGYDYCNDVGTCSQTTNCS
jgi:hypothetical protein